MKPQRNYCFGTVSYNNWGAKTGFTACQPLPSSKPMICYRYLKPGNQAFHGKYVLVPADKAPSNVVNV